jgi:uncharacterized protein (DUF4415 family)
MRFIDLAKRGEYGRTSTPEQITARRRGHPAGSVAASRKMQITLRIDSDVQVAFRATGRG